MKLHKIPTDLATALSHNYNWEFSLQGTQIVSSLKYFIQASLVKFTLSKFCFLQMQVPIRELD